MALRPPSLHSISPPRRLQRLTCPQSRSVTKGMGVASQLELLGGAHQNDVGFSSDDEVEAPNFDEERYPDSPIRAVSHSVGLERDGSTFEIDEQRPSNEYNGSVFLCT